MNKYLSIINYRTLIAIIIALVTVFFTYRFNLYYNIDLTLLSIAIIFPLVFNIRGSFKRREKALEHLSQFRSALKTLHYFFMSCSELTENKKQEVSNILLGISNNLISHLGNNGYKTKNIDESIQKVFEFINDNNELIPRRIRDRLFRFLNDLHESVENLHAIHCHRIPISLKAYCEYFIYVFPLFYSPSMIYNVGIDSPRWVTYFIVIVSQFILISLYNIQDQLEYPFDKVGLDDINLEIFKFDR
jgi:hypothetical protein